MNLSGDAYTCKYANTHKHNILKWHNFKNGLLINEKSEKLEGMVKWWKLRISAGGKVKILLDQKKKNSTKLTSLF